MHAHALLLLLPFALSTPIAFPTPQFETIGQAALTLLEELPPLWYQQPPFNIMIGTAITSGLVETFGWLNGKIDEHRQYLLHKEDLQKKEEKEDVGLPGTVDDDEEDEEE